MSSTVKVFSKPFMQGVMEDWVTQSPLQEISMNHTSTVLLEKQEIKSDSSICWVILHST